MKLLVINGSPRGRKSNSDKMLKWIFNETFPISGDSVEKIYVVDRKERDQQMKLMEGSDSILVIFPLYTDGMPGITMEVFEQMELSKDRLKSKSIAYIIHSGFPEARQSRAVEKYVRHLSNLLGMNYLGTVVMPGSEALVAAPDSMFKKKIPGFQQIGKCMLENKAFDQDMLAIIAGNEILPPIQLFVLKHFNVSNFFWNHQLKKNGAFGRRFDAPYK